MKRFIYNILILAFISLGIMSCNEDFLEQTDPDSLTSDNYYRNQSDAEAALATVYAQIGAANRWDVTEVNIVVENFRSDLVKPGPDSWNYPDWTAISTFSYTEGNSRFTIYWEDSYRGINHANQVIENVGEMAEGIIDAGVKNQIIGEAKFLRAFLYFRLLNNWERVPLITEYAKSEEDLHNPLAERADVWTQIETDLTEAAAALPAAHANADAGRATSGAAYAYLGKAHLHQGEWNDAVTAFENIIGDYNLQPTLLSNFDGTAENNDESVFEIQYTPNRVDGRHMGHVLAFSVAPGEMGGWGNIEATDRLLSEMQNEGMIATTGLYDTRLYETLIFDDPNVDIYGDTYGNVFASGVNKIIFRKFLPPPALYPFSNNSAWYWANNAPQMRYADVLLMYAEALNEAGSTAQSFAPVNEVRNRADMPDLSGLSQAEMRVAIRHERAMELALEGHRFFDLRRWGILETNIQNSGKVGASNFSEATHAYFPIPESEQNANSAID